MRVDFNEIPRREVQNGGAGLVINYGRARCVFGPCFLVWCRYGVYALHLGGDYAAILSDLRARWPEAEFVESERTAELMVSDIFSDSNGRIAVCVDATEFRMKVWRSLALVPYGQRVTYSELAERIGDVSAVRAVASAVAANRLGYIIPCHRVVRKNGDLGGFFWGLPLKRRMLEWEQENV